MTMNTSKALGEFVGRELHKFITDSEARQIEFCLDTPTASLRGKRWAIARTRAIGRDADIVDDIRSSDRNGPPAERLAKKAEKRERDREIRSRMKGGSGKKK